MKQVNLYEAKTNLSALVEEAKAGEEIVIAKNGKPQARLVAIQPEPEKPLRRFGFWDRYGWKAPDNLVELLRTDPEEIALWENGPVFPEDGEPK
ncbi:MAG: type II toxin-antitoxin system prevent-host-death family antitoxin [Caulobacteraceae bacterium]